VRYLLHQLLGEAAQNDPTHEAVRCSGRSLTYGELDAAANGIARTLIAAGVRPGDRVGIHLKKCVESIPAVYGTLRAGAAYVPLDPLAPAVRLGPIADDCSVSALITTPAGASSLSSSVRHAPRLVVLVDAGPEPVDLPWPWVTYEDATADPEATDPAVPSIEMDLAYILYISGSTGVPKGVMLTHRNGLAFVEWSAARIGVRPDDRLSNHAPLHFDLSVLDVFLAAMGRATLVMVPEEDAYFGTAIARFIRDEGVTIWYSVPSALMLLTKAAPDPAELSSLRTVVFAGEVYPTRRLRELQDLVPRATLWNLYGPTETNVVTYHRVGTLPEGDRTIPIGRPCDGTEVFGLKDDGTIAAVGEEGELYVRGPTVMKGYWGKPERTAEVLVPHPITPHLADRAYRTGDLVRQRDDGEYDFFGRRDHQIKSRGYRIELGEVESVLNAIPAVELAVAVAIPHEEWGTAIVAFVTPRDGQSPTPTELKRHVADRLPRYMVPTRVAMMRQLPRTSTGKIDRRQLMADSLRDAAIALETDKE
jgi:amino acid adenylation domain-containing protein